MTLRQLYEQLLPLVLQRPSEEGCGLLFGPPGPVPTTVTSVDVTRIQPSPNRARDKSCRFEIDSALLRKAWRQPDLIGVYHSHLDGPAIASREDESLVEQGLISVIVALGQLRVYGRHQGRMIELASWLASEKEVTP